MRRPWAPEPISDDEASLRERLDQIMAVRPGAEGLVREAGVLLEKRIGRLARVLADEEAGAGLSGVAKVEAQQEFNQNAADAQAQLVQAGTISDGAVAALAALDAREAQVRQEASERRVLPESPHGQPPSRRSGHQRSRSMSQRPPSPSLPARRRRRDRPKSATPINTGG